MVLARLKAKREKEKDERAARKRHLQRAQAGIDKSQRSPENLLFKTVTRDQYNKFNVPKSENIEFVKYNPKKASPNHPCFVKISDPAADRKEQKVHLEPSLQYAQKARCKDLAPKYQHTELPHISCKKLDQRLENMKEMIIERQDAKKERRQKFEEMDSTENFDISYPVTMNQSIEQTLESGAVLRRDGQQGVTPQGLNLKTSKTFVGGDSSINMSIPFSSKNLRNRKSPDQLSIETSFDLKRLYDKKDSLEKIFGDTI